MTDQEREEVIIKFKKWFKNSLIANHIKNTKKLKNIKELTINPFLTYYLANYFKGNSKPINLAKVIVYPRVLGTSINTSFGTHMQNFIVKVLGAYASPTEGLDIEFIDYLDGRRKYCQLKAGPNVINKDGVKTITDHFKGIKNRAKGNHSDIRITDLAFCLIYGENSEKNSFIKRLENDYEVYIGKDFWHRFTGDQDFYKHLINAAGEVAREMDMKDILQSVIEDLSKSIEKRFSDLFD